MRVLFRAGLAMACLFLFSEPSHAQVYDNQCPGTQSSMVPMRTVNIANGHFNDTVCADSSGNLIFQTLSASLSASDTFTRANATTLGPNWSTPSGAGVFGITTNAAKNISGTGVAFWNDPRFVSTAQFSQVTISIQGADNVGPAVMISSGAGNEYTCFQGTGASTLTLSRRLGGGGTTLASGATTGASGDVLRLEIDSSGNLTCYKNGVSTLTATDTTYKIGSPGIFDVGTLSSITNWSGGNLPVSQGTGPSFNTGPSINLPGQFSDNVMDEYVKVNLNSCNSLGEFQAYFTGLFNTSSFTSCISVPSSATKFQATGFQSYLNNASSILPAVALSGLVRATATNAKVFGLNTVAQDCSVAACGGGGFSSTAIHSYEVDLNLFTSPSSGDAILCGGLFNTGTTSHCLDVGAPQGGTNPFWTYGVRFQSAATQAPSANGAAIFFGPVAAGLNQASQGESFNANDPSAGVNVATINELATGDLETQFSKAATGLRVPILKHDAAGLSATGWIQQTNTDSIGWRNFANNGDLVISVDTSNRLRTDTFVATMATQFSQPGASAGTGFLSMVSGGSIAWRNNANSADILLSKNTSDLLTFAGNTIQLPVYNSSGTVQNTAHVVQDTATLAAGTVTVTLTGSAVYTNATSYTCVADDDTAIGATRVLQNSGSSITITGTGTDVIRYICIGN